MIFPASLYLVFHLLELCMRTRDTLDTSNNLAMYSFPKSFTDWIKFIFFLCQELLSESRNWILKIVLCDVGSFCQESKWSINWLEISWEGSRPREMKGGSWIFWTVTFPPPQRSDKITFNHHNHKHDGDDHVLIIRMIMYNICRLQVVGPNAISSQLGGS